MKSWLITLLAVAGLVACGEPVSPRSIENSGSSVPPPFIGSPAEPRPISFSAPEHPYMAAPGRSAMHADGYSSDVHPGPGPLGNNIQLVSRDGSRHPGGQCATLTFDREQQLVMLCAAMTGFNIHLLEPRTLKLLAEYHLPVRASSYQALRYRDPRYIMEDSSSAYFYLDQHDRLVIAPSDHSIRRVGHRQLENGRWEFYLDSQWDMRGEVPHDCVTLFNWSPEGECDPITSVMPDYSGLIWWVTRRGRVGTLNPDTGVVRSRRVEGEEIQNSFSVAEDGVYIVSDHAMYRFEADADGMPQIGWRELYDRGTASKVGSINQGSGTTPTLIGDDYLTFTDNADGRINLRVMRRRQQVEGERLVCAVPLFQSGHSATDNSMIAFNRSVIIENNAGYLSAAEAQDWGEVKGGVMRIDVREDESGCDVVWHSPLKSPSVVPKLSAQNGLVYLYTFEPQSDGENAWYIAALDVNTGDTRFKVLTGLGKGFDNNWAPLTLAPDGTLYVGTYKGVVAVWDGEAE